MKELALLVAICALSLVGTAEDVTIPLAGPDGLTEDLLCLVGDEFTPPGRKLRLLDELFATSTSDPFHVAHGWWAWIDCFDGMGPSEICVYARDHLRFDLWVDGIWIRPSMLSVHQAPYETDVEAWKEAEGSMAWVVRWIFEFPAQSLTPSIYRFEGHWQREVPARCYFPDETFPDILELSCTVLVSY